jgi:NAD(P)-dependent dehydrogenase (short-subunit alcohol dehydrogenase family)
LRLDFSLKLSHCGVIMNKTVLITGAAQRIGHYLALELARLKYNVIVHYNNSQAKAFELVEEIKGLGVDSIAVQANLSDEACVNRLIPTINQQFGRVDILINNASSFVYDSVSHSTRTSWDLHLETNLRAPFVLSQNFIQQTEYGTIINMLDQRVWNLTPHYISYTLSKAGLWTLTQTLALALAPKIRVNAVGPGPTLQNIHQTEQQFSKQCEAVPMKSAARLEDISAAVQFLLAATSVTGQMIAVDGGQHLGWSFPNNPNQRED